ncbi:MAG TPA: tetratricopeptide repeat protein [Abditibacteriaceae bacterium]
MRIELFNGLCVRVGTQTITRFRSQKTAELLAYLAFHPQRMHPREVLIGLLWPEFDTSAARKSLRVALSSLRHQLEPPGVAPGSIILADPSAVGLHAGAIATDVAEFESALEAGSRASNRSEQVELLGRATQLYCGELLPGYYSDWVLLEQRRLAELFFGALTQVLAHLRGEGDVERAIPFAEHGVRVDPLREEAHLQLIRLYVATHQWNAAQRRYRDLEHILRERLDETPSAMAQSLAREIERQSSGEPSQSSQPSHDLHAPSRRKSRVNKPIRSDSFSTRELPSPPAGVAPAPQVYLPFLPTRFFGREEELARLRGMLSSPNGHNIPHGIPHEPRLLTLTGASGSGKTRLALELAWQLAKDSGTPRRGAICFVSLGDLRNAALIPGEIVDALRLSRSSDGEPLDLLVETLGREPSFLLLDDFEHLVDDGAPIVGALLERVPDLLCLVTSQRRLGLSGEREWLVVPLSVPHREEHDARSAERLVQWPAVQLFVDRAQAVRADFQVTPANAEAVAELCERLEGIPLAIELVAARAGVMTPRQMLSHLTERLDFFASRQRHVAERRRTLRSAVSWSFRLLRPELQQFFSRLAFFRNGWTWQAAQVVCENTQALDDLDQLREYSLVVADETEAGMRFRLLETLREYAAEQVPADAREELQRRHAAYYVLLAEEGAQGLSGSMPGEWLHCLEVEQDNLRAALAWSLEREPLLSLRLAAALGWFWEMRGHFAEGYDWLQQVLAVNHPRPASNQSTLFAASSREQLPLADALKAAGRLANHLADNDSARSHLEQSLAIYRQLDDKQGIADALFSLSFALVNRGNYELARSLCEESLALQQELGQISGLFDARYNRALIALFQGDFALANTLSEENLILARKLGDARRTAVSRQLIGLCAAFQGDQGTARSHLEESLETFQTLHEKGGMSRSLWGLGTMAFARGDLETAHDYYSQSLAMVVELNNRWALPHLLEAFGWIAAARGYAARSRVEQESSHEAAEKAPRLLGAAEYLRQSLEIPLPPVFAVHSINAQSTARFVLGDDVFTVAWNAGRAMSLERAIALAQEP